MELGRRLGEPEHPTRPIRSPADAASHLMPVLVDREQEYLYVLLLDTRSRVLRPPVEVYHGAMNTALIRAAEVFREAVKMNAASLIVAHCHPSQDPSPSPEDVAVTRELVQAGKLLDIHVVDHLIIGGPARFVSLKERGLGFGS
jgi:DNA repair protein RadC